MAIGYGSAFSMARFGNPGTGNLVPDANVDLTTAKGVLVFVVQTGASTDQVTGVTCGGVAMTRVQFAQDTAGETGATYAYFLGSGIPSGSQSFTVTVSGAATKAAYRDWYTASANTEVVASNKLEGDRANPQIALDSGASSALRSAVTFSGLASTTDLTRLTGFGDASAIQTDFGQQVGVVCRENAASSGSKAVGWTSASDDVAMVALAVAEVAAAATKALPFRRRTNLSTLLRR